MKKLAFILTAIVFVLGSVLAAPAAVLVVTNTNDAGSGSLRQAILQANTAPDLTIILFHGSIYGQTITLTSGELTITNDIIITAPATAPLTIRRDPAAPRFRIFNVNDGNNSVGRSVTFTGLIITNGATDDRGGGIYNAENLVLQDCAVSGNSAHSGGGIAVSAPKLTVIHSTIANNVAVVGGGVFSDSCPSLDFTDSTIDGNTTRAPGGGVWYNYSGGRLTFTRCTISRNYANGGFQGEGGAIIFWEGDVRLTNSTVSENRASGRGGGIRAATYYVIGGGRLILENTTIFNNFAAGGGGGLQAGDQRHNSSPSPTLIMTNSVVAHNNSDISWKNGPDPAPMELRGVNLVEDGSVTAPNVLNQNPLLGPLQHNGGPTLTHSPQTSLSPVVDSADAALAPSTDQRTAPRPRGAGADLGAVEAGPVLLVDHIIDEDDGNVSAGNTSLREALSRASVGEGYLSPAIIFAPALRGGTIELALGELVIDKSLSVTAVGAGITIDAKQNSRVFSVDDGSSANHRTVTLGGLTITGGAANGGAGVLNRENLILRNVTIRNNATAIGGSGGGVYHDGRSLAIVNSTIDSNSARNGGGVFVLFGQDADHIVNSTITSNSASNSGGGIYNFGGAAPTTIANSIIAYSGSGNDVGGLPPKPIGKNIVADGSFTASGVLRGDPFLGPLKNNGGPTFTRALLLGSMAINAGDNSVTLAGANFPSASDQRGDGFARIADNQVDLGAFEAQGVTPTPANDSYNVTQNTTFSVPTPGVLANDANAVTAALVSGPAHASGFTLHADGSFTYTPTSGFAGTDSFTYRAGNNELQSGIATATLTVREPNRPISADDSYHVSRNYPLSIKAPGVLAKYTNPGTAALVSGPAHASNFSLQADGSFTYTPAPGFVGMDAFTYRAVNTGLTSDITTVTISVREPLLVTKTADTNDGVCDSDCSLREAIAAAFPHETILFSSLFDTPQTINLNLSLSVNDRNIRGKGANVTTLRTSGHRHFLISGDVTLSGLALMSAEYPGSVGFGGIKVETAGSLTLLSSAVVGNAADDGAGGGISSAGALHIDGSIIAENLANGYVGGGIYCVGQLTVINSTISGNESDDNGGGIYASSDSLIVNSTVAGNRCGAFWSASGGGIAVQGHMVLRNTIVAGNINLQMSEWSGLSPTVDDVAPFDGAAQSIYNLIGDAATAGGITHGVNGNIVGNNGSGTIDISTVLDPNLRNNGGRTPTHALVVGSLALNAGGSFAGLPATDQRGLARIYGDAPDIGAYEVNSTFPSSAINKVVSRKTHGGAGTFEITLPRTGTHGVECRSGGAGGAYQIVFSFVNPLSNVVSANVAKGTGVVSSRAVGSNPREYIVNLSRVADAQTMIVVLNGVSDSAGNYSDAIATSVGVRLSDTNGDGAVNSADALQTRNASGQTTNANNFRADANCDGTVNSGDATMVRARSGQFIP